MRWSASLQASEREKVEALGVMLAAVAEATEEAEGVRRAQYAHMTSRLNEKAAAMHRGLDGLKKELSQVEGALRAGADGLAGVQASHRELMQQAKTYHMLYRKTKAARETEIATRQAALADADRLDEEMKSRESARAQIPNKVAAEGPEALRRHLEQKAAALALRLVQSAVCPA